MSRTSPFEAVETGGSAMTKSIECIDCGASVPYGRLACPACGAVLASVGRRPATILTAVEDAPSDPEPALLPDDVATPAPQNGDPVLRPVPYRSSHSSDAGAAVAREWPSDAVAVHLPDDATRFAEIAGWFVVVGATMAILGFLLPWSVVVIGARMTGSYFDTWGLASPTHVLIFAAIMLVLALGIVRTAVPIWIRSGVLPLALGSLLIGLAWPYQVGPLGADVGILVVALGALSLVIGGVVATWATRHGEVDPRV